MGICLPSTTAEFSGAGKVGLQPDHVNADDDGGKTRCGSGRQTLSLCPPVELPCLMRGQQNTKELCKMRIMMWTLCSNISMRWASQHSMCCSLPCPLEALFLGPTTPHGNPGAADVSPMPWEYHNALDMKVASYLFYLFQESQLAPATLGVHHPVFSLFMDHRGS